MLRPYQAKAMDKIRELYTSGTKRVLLSSPCGSGKTKIFCDIMKSAAAKGNHCLFLVRGRRLVSQACERLEREHTKFSVLMAGDKRIDEEAKITCASIDTLFARKLVPKATLIVIDEAHLACSESFNWVLSNYPEAYILAVTATPFSKAGFKKMADVIVETISVRELIEQGFLVGAKYYAPKTPDLTTVKKANGDYVVKDLAEVLNRSVLFGDVVESYKKLGENRPAFMFAVNVDHSKRLVKAFVDAGIKALHLDANSPQDTRDQALSMLETGEVKIVSSVGICGVGVDAPSVSCIILCRPTLSYALHIQLLGRGSRVYPGKKDFRVLDHAGNVISHGFFETPRMPSLDGKSPQVILSLCVCKSCFATYRRSEGACPSELPDGSICGVKPEPKPQKREIKIDESQELSELTGELLEKEQMKRWMLKTIIDARDQGKKKGFAFYQVKSRYGSDVANASWRLIHECYAAE